MEQIIQTEFGKSGERFKNISTPLTELNKVPIEHLFEKNGKFYYTTNGEEKNISTKETAFIDMVADIELLKEEDTFICMKDMTLPTIPTIKAKQNNVYIVLTASPDLEVSFIGNINPKDYVNDEQLLNVESRIPRNLSQLTNDAGYIKNRKDAYDYNNLKNKPIIPEGAKLYSTTGQNTDGAMTQKVVTDNLELKASKKYVDDKFAGLGDIFVIKGTVQAISNLPTENNKIGDVWYVKAEKVGYVWINDNGVLRWEPLGPEFNVDLSDYYTIEQTDQRLKAVENKIPDTSNFITAFTKDLVYYTNDNDLQTKLNGYLTQEQGSRIVENRLNIQKTEGGFQAGENAFASSGGAIGKNSKTSHGGSVGENAYSGDGFSGGYNAKVGVNQFNIPYNAIQLGAGTNNQAGTLQVYNDNIYDVNTHTLKVNNAKINGKDVLTQDKLLNLIYPVGAVYISTTLIDPSKVFGGTWEQIKDTFLLSAGNTYQNGHTGGSSTHTLTIDEMPSHTHTQQSHNHLQNEHGHTQKPHGHQVLSTDRGDGYAWGLGRPKSGGLSGVMNSNANTNYTNDANGRRVIIQTTAENVPVTATNKPTTAVNNNTGGGLPHNNMPPYFVVYMWKRTA